jgi:hypothetical protein
VYSFIFQLVILGARMEKTQLQLEYLKEQYTQARQHETLRTNVTTFLTAAAAVILGLIFKEGSSQQLWWGGLLVAAIGAANWWINRAHFLGNRFHTTLAGKARRAIEEDIKGWSNDRPSDLRREVVKEYHLDGPGVSLGGKIQEAIQLVPAGIVFLGLLMAVLLKYSLLHL